MSPPSEVSQLDRFNTQVNQLLARLEVERCRLDTEKDRLVELSGLFKGLAHGKPKQSPKTAKRAHETKQ